MLIIDHVRRESYLAGQVLRKQLSPRSESGTAEQIHAGSGGLGRQNPHWVGSASQVGLALGEKDWKCRSHAGKKEWPYNGESRLGVEGQWIQDTQGSELAANQAEDREHQRAHLGQDGPH